LSITGGPTTGAVRRGREPLGGVVEEFDDERGLGTVSGEDGRRYTFHCTALSDGSRYVAVGTHVLFVRRSGHLGRVEATALTQR
jgi:cold shock CspA family protein